MNEFAPALGVANAVLYEGYLLFPYTASSEKNRVRWQFGVVVPQAYLSAETGEHAAQQTELFVEDDGAARIAARLRFLHVEARSVEAATSEGFVPVPSLEVDGVTYLTFDEAVEREIDLTLEAAPGRRTVALDLPGGFEVEALYDRTGALRGRVSRERWPLRGTFALEAVSHADGPVRIARLRARVENHSGVVAGERSSALRTSFVSTHVVLAVSGGRFCSVLDPPESLGDATASLVNEQTFPVLVGDGAADPQRAAVALSSPIILYDFPALGAQTDADAFDATEIDELLTLSVLSLSDAERAEARATDPRARAIVERAERFGPEAIARLHAGALHRTRGEPVNERLADPDAAIGPAGGDDGVASTLDGPRLESVTIGGSAVARGSLVRLHPKGRADLWDSLLAEKIATVRAIHHDFDDRTYVAVTVDEDPASDLHDWYGRAFFFSPEEIEPLAHRSAP